MSLRLYRVLPGTRPNTTSTNITTWLSLTHGSTMVSRTSDIARLTSAPPRLQHNGLTLTEVDIYLRTAIEAGVLATEVTHDNVTGHCKTEQCFWKPYNTLAICSRVEDATDMLSFDYNPPRVPVGGDNITVPENRYQVPNKSCNFHVQGKFFLANRYQLGIEEKEALTQRATPNNTETNLPDLAQIYLSYFDPCLGRYNTSGGIEPETWRAYKATFNLCVQTHNSSQNASGMHTTVISNNVDLKWANETYPVNTSDPDSIMKNRYCAQPPNSTERFCIEEKALKDIGGQLATTLDIKAYLGVIGDHYYSYAQWAPNLSNDVLGIEPADPARCSANISGMAGYDHRIKNIANSLSNA